ncbi:MAG: GH3 auxin-responsive promoter family protein [Verrucomicrobia bacterium]|nr:GH3 auxin-responsive promoter family protein [Verrucomicrobiota bacterium]MBU1909315.1 GH3 auxin-responsive promoter family protein [Verrucomicrobiota bacterium]
MNTLLKAALRIQGGAQRRSFDRSTAEPRAAQQRLLLDILARNRDTEYGREHGFSRVHDGEAFARLMPVTTFSDLAPYVEKIKNGQANVLTADSPFMFCLTSGTTDKPKFLPITRKGRDLAVRLSYQWFHRALRDHPSFLDHSILLISGASIEGTTPAGIPYGSASGMICEGLPRRLCRSFTLPASLPNIKDYGLRYYLMARLALAQEVSCIVTPNPTTLIQIAEVAIRHQEEIVRAIRDGRVVGAWPFEQGREDLQIVSAIRASMRPNRRRARFLEAVIRRHGELLPFACWNHLKLIGCWLGGSVGFQTEKLSRCYGESVPKRDIGYLASEGSMTIPYQDNTPAGILALPNNYYEFVPEGESNATAGVVLQCHQVELGKRYKIILTNGNGLYRYDMDDVVEIQGFYNRTPVAAFMRKGDDLLNITGEKLHANHVLGAFRRLKDELGVTVKQFRVVPNYAERRYEILMHLAPEPPKAFLKNTVLPFIDQSLCEANVEYDSKRKSDRLLSPCIHLMSPSWEEDVRARFLAAGRRDVQYKWRMMATEISALDAMHKQETIQM